MAVAHSATFRAGPDRVWGVVLKVVTSAGYTVAETDNAAKRLAYVAGGGAFAFSQVVVVTVTGVGDDESLVTARAEAETYGTLMEAHQQRNLVEFLFEQLQAQLPLAAGQPTNAPGAEGCSVPVSVVVVLVLTALVCLCLA